MTVCYFTMLCNFWPMIKDPPFRNIFNNKKHLFYFCCIRCHFLFYIICAFLDCLAQYGPWGFFFTFFFKVISLGKHMNDETGGWQQFWSFCSKLKRNTYKQSHWTENKYIVQFMKRLWLPLPSWGVQSRRHLLLLLCLMSMHKQISFQNSIHLGIVHNVSSNCSIPTNTKSELAL